MPIPFLVDLGLLIASVLAALGGIIVALFGLYDLLLSYVRDDRERWKAGATVLGVGLVMVGAGYLLQSAI